MKLVLTWLLGVPLLVGSMVLARAALIPSQAQAEIAELATAPASQSCPGQSDQHAVLHSVAKDGDRRACEPLSVE